MSPVTHARRPPRSGRRAREAARRGRRDVSAVAYERLRDAIVTLKLAPGAPLIELELCHRLQVSRTPVRAALQRLQQEGFVVSADLARVRRLMVSPLTTNDMRELFLMVGSLDGLAARLAAQLDPASRAPVIEKMRQLNAELSRISTSSELSETARAQDLDLGFHQCYEEAAAGPRLLAELHALHDRRARYVRVYTQALVRARNLQESALEHEAIIAAVAAGDAEAAERSAAFNYRNALERYSRIVSILGERGNW